MIKIFRMAVNSEAGQGKGTGWGGVHIQKHC